MHQIFQRPDENVLFCKSGKKETTNHRKSKIHTFKNFNKNGFP